MLPNCHIRLTKQNLERIAELVRGKIIDGITICGTKIDRQECVVIELRGCQPQCYLNQLFKHTQMQENFGVIMLVLSITNPGFDVKDYSTITWSTRRIITHRTKFNLEKAEARATSEGLRSTLDHCEVKINSLLRTAEIAKEGLMTSLASPASQAILDMRLQHLTGLERDKIENEYQDLKMIAYYKGFGR